MAGKVALVTGSTMGIGLGMAHHLAKAGYDVIITGLGEQQLIDGVLETFRSTYKGAVHFVGGDLSTEEGVAQLCAGVTKLYPDGVDVLINNAGIQHVAHVEDYPVDTWHKMVAIHLTAPFLLIRYFLPFMKKKGWGRIVNQASQMAKISTPGKVPYSTTKAGLVGMTKGVALESAEFGVTCNAICPGYADSEMVRKQAQEKADRLGVSFQQIWDEFCNAHPTKKLITIDQIASLVVYLCSEDAANITGTDISIDAGNTAQ